MKTHTYIIILYILILNSCSINKKLEDKVEICGTFSFTKSELSQFQFCNNTIPSLMSDSTSYLISIYDVLISNDTCLVVNYFIKDKADGKLYKHVIGSGIIGTIDYYDEIGINYDCFNSPKHYILDCKYDEFHMVGNLLIFKTMNSMNCLTLYRTNGRFKSNMSAVNKRVTDLLNLYWILKRKAALSE